MIMVYEILLPLSDSSDEELYIYFIQKKKITQIKLEILLMNILQKR